MKNIKRLLKWRNARWLLLAAMVTGLIAAALGCISGISAIGWSGGTISGNTIYVGSREGRLVAVNLADESRQWSEQIKMPTQGGLFGCSTGCNSGTTGMAIYGDPLVVGSLVYFAGYNGKIYAYNAGNVTQSRWVYPRDSNLQPFVGGLVTDGTRLFIGSSDGKIYALDAVTGDKLWEFATGEKVWATPAIDKGTLYIGSFDKKLYALNAADGSKKWEFTTNGAIMATPLIYQNTLYFGSVDRNFYAVNANDGKEIWHISANNWFWAQPAMVNGTIYAGSLDGNVYVINANIGTLVTTLDLNSPVASQPVVVGDSVIFATRKGLIYNVNTTTNQATQIADVKIEIDGPLTATNGIVYAQTQNLALQRINVASSSLLSPIILKAQ